MCGSRGGLHTFLPASLTRAPGSAAAGPAAYRVLPTRAASAGPLTGSPLNLTNNKNSVKGFTVDRTLPKTADWTTGPSIPPSRKILVPLEAVSRRFLVFFTSFLRAYRRRRRPPHSCDRHIGGPRHASKCPHHRRRRRRLRRCYLSCPLHTRPRSAKQEIPLPIASRSCLRRMRISRPATNCKRRPSLVGLV
ncbi:hypothetical protein GQ607_017482 [Colletotrichum asianum]|uniref:Uncharacterized protein n=1 Tax=Colletotrichum asianum TaxID=702518 RepID=A0A8H3VUL7_9PEZI|nr:hypothetical protein GQ607_017482 [Colletotrichum asianum]